MIQRSKKSCSHRWPPLAITASVLTVIILLFRSFSSLSEGYMQMVYPVIAAVLSAGSSLIPFSFFDVFLLVAIVFILGLIVWSIVKRVRFSLFAYRLAWIVIVVIGWFYMSWGVSYFRHNFYTRCHILQTPYTDETLKAFAVRYIQAANDAYVDCSELNRYGQASILETSYSRLDTLLAINYPNGHRRVKSMLFEQLFSKVGVSGYFGPFFNELHVNSYLLNTDYPFTLAHEMAHQFGIGSEAECNLLAFAVCVNADDKKTQYSAYFSLLRYLLNDVYVHLSEVDANEIKAMIRPEIIEDLQINRAHWTAAYDPTLSKIQNVLYDAYLKGNKISSGTSNYSEVIGLLVSSYDRFVD